jgi:predicted AlkP superfamily pyrophosphatase or phosphodiesterase
LNKVLVFIPLFLELFLSGSIGAAERNTQNVILITLDGARTQEIFGGLDLDILKSVVKRGRLEDRPVYGKYWASTAQERREKLMPFFWGTWMKKYGHIYGNRSLGSTATITNKHRFSYPGYSEILTGEAHDDVINSNDSKRNPYPSVLEFLKTKLGLPSERVAAFSSWETMNWIAEHKEGTIPINAGFEAYQHPDADIHALSQLQFETLTPWGSVRHDIYTFRFAMAHLKRFKPRVLYLSLGETDDWAHDGEYERVLEALHQTDERFRRLWEFLEADGQYRGKTSIVISTDHGRGNGPADWKDHGKEVEGAQYIWLGIVSPDSPKRGEQSNAEQVHQNQIAATLCRFLGIDYGEHNPNAGKPVE